jgi:hypothetical protein
MTAARSPIGDLSTKGARGMTEVLRRRFQG